MVTVGKNNAEQVKDLTAFAGCDIIHSHNVAKIYWEIYHCTVHSSGKKITSRDVILAMIFEQNFECQCDNVRNGITQSQGNLMVEVYFLTM